VQYIVDHFLGTTKMIKSSADDLRALFDGHVCVKILYNQESWVFLCQ
jgi:hypothetical protein